MPIKNTSQRSWEGAGGVSERAGAKAGGSNPFALISFACRDGRRHPGLLEGGALRGASSERRSRSVRKRAAASSATRKRADDTGCPEAAEEGNDVGMRHKAHATIAGTRDRSHAQGDASFTRSFDPCTSILTSTVEQSPVVGQSRWHHGWANPRKWDEPALGPSRMDGARLATCQRSRKGSCLARKKRMEVEASLPARIARARVWLPARRIAVAEVGRRRLASNKLGKRAPKRAAGSSEQGSSPSRSSVGDTIVGYVERNDASRVGLTARNGRGPAQGSGWREIVIQRSLHRPKTVRWSRDRGCNGHWILRRVLTGGRHPGSSRSVGFHETAWTMGLAFCRFLRPVANL
jgi:hypothetical protein